MLPSARQRGSSGRSPMSMHRPPPYLPIRALGIQTRIICLVILIVACVLFLSSYLDSTLSEQAFEKDLRDQTISLAQELAAGLAVQQIIRAPEVLNKEIQAATKLRKNLHSIEVFLAGVQGPALAASTPGPSQAVLKAEVWDGILEGRVLTALERF